MQHIGRFFIWVMALLVLWNCSSYKAQRQEALLSFPELGTLVKAKGDLFYNAAEQVGIPDWPVLNVGVQQLPFNKASYAQYAKTMQRAGKINSIAYNDSLPYKPKYLRLQLLDKLELTQLLNNEANDELRAYVPASASILLVPLMMSNSKITVSHGRLARGFSCWVTAPVVKY